MDVSFIHSKTAKIDSNFTNVSFIMLPSCSLWRNLWLYLGISALFLLFLIFCSSMKIHFRIGGDKKQRYLIFFKLPNNNIGWSINQSVIKKLTSRFLLNHFVSLKILELFSMVHYNNQLIYDILKLFNRNEHFIKRTKR